MKIMKRDLAPFALRLDPELKDWLKHKAVDNRRSLNSEIEHRLMQSKEREKAA